MNTFDFTQRKVIQSQFHYSQGYTFTFLSMVLSKLSFIGAVLICHEVRSLPLPPPPPPPPPICFLRPIHTISLMTI